MNLYKIKKYCIYFIFILNLGILNIYQNIFATAQRFSICITVFLFIIFLLEKGNKKGLSFQVSLIVILFIIFFLFEIFRSGIAINSYLTFGDKVYLMSPFLLTLLYFPMVDVIKVNRVSFLKGVFYIGVSFFVLRTLAWLLLNYGGLNIAPGFFEERGINWVRYGTVRLQGSFLDGYVLIYSFLGILSKNRKKQFYYFTTLLSLFYSFKIYGSRSQFLIYIFIIICMYVFKDGIQFSGILKVSTIALVCFIINKLPFVNNFLNSFSVQDSEYGAGTAARINGNIFFHSYWNLNQLLGFGVSFDENHFGIIKYFLSDLGIVGSFYQFGYLGIVVLLIPLVYAIIIGMINYKFIYGKVALFLSMYLLLTSFASQNVYNSIRIAIVPFLLCLINECILKRNENS